MKIFTGFSSRRIKPGGNHRPALTSILISLLTICSLCASGQTLSWSEQFVQGSPTTPEQCEKWNTFLDNLANKTFASVTLSGSFDPTGKSINDPDVATRLAYLLSTRTPGSVQVGSEYWTVTTCGTTICSHNGAPSIELSINTTGDGCLCNSTYAVRAGIVGPNWGGVNTSTCPGPSQTMTLEFNSGVSIIASGPTTICRGGSVVLTASTEICSAPYQYLWSNGATTESITVTEPGSYSVTVTSADGCSGTSAATTVSISEISVDAGPDITICSEPAQLSATGTPGVTGGAQVNKYCVFDAPGGAGNCSFTNNLCSAGDGSVKVVNSSFAQSISQPAPDELRILLYYSPYSLVTTFNFILNGHSIGSFVDNNPSGDCEPGKYGQYPRVISFPRAEIASYWNDNGPNDVSVGVAADEDGVYLAGVVVETTMSNESFVWSPVTGLNDPAVANPMASPGETTTYTVTYTDPNGCTATDQVVVTVNCNTAPVAVCKPVTVEADANCEALVAAADFDGGSTSPSGSPLTFSISPEGPYAVGETAITFTVTDANGESSSCTTTLTVTDSTLPVITTPEEIVVENDPGSCGATVNLVPPETSDNCGIASVTNDHPDNIFPVGETTVVWKVRDSHGNERTAQQKVVVINHPPVITAATVSPSAVEANEDVSVSVAFEDNNFKSLDVDWGDNSAVETVAHSESLSLLSHRYAHEGKYSIKVTVTDQCDASASSVCEPVTVVERHSGYVRGDGWFNSMPGYYLRNRRAAGKAHFEFKAEYSHGGQLLSGRISFRFKDGPIDFRSTGLDLLDVDGQEASLSGYGKLNGKNGYRILIGMYDDKGSKDHGHDKDDDAGDKGKPPHDKDKPPHDKGKPPHDKGKPLHDKDKPSPGKDKPSPDKDKPQKDKGKSPSEKHNSPKDKPKPPGGDPHGGPDHHEERDRIRVKIWDPDGSVVYDTQAGSPDDATADTPLGGGSIEVREQSFGDFVEDVIASYLEGRPSVYPNPFKDRLSVQYSSGSNEKVNLQLMDLTGKVIFNQTFPVSDDGYYAIDLGKGAHKGIYILIIRQGMHLEILRVVRD